MLLCSYVCMCVCVLCVWDFGSQGGCGSLNLIPTYKSKRWTIAVLFGHAMHSGVDVITMGSFARPPLRYTDSESGTVC